jgi:hypothetical protein
VECPLCLGKLKRGDINRDIPFSCPSCHKWLCCRGNNWTRTLRWLVAAFSLGVIVFGEIKGMRVIKTSGGLALLFLSGIEIFFRSRNPEMVIEPAMPGEGSGARRG